MQLAGIPTTALSGAGTTNGTANILGDRKRLGYQAIWTGTLAGTFAWQISNDFAIATPANATWTALTVPGSFAAGNPAGAPGAFFFDFSIAPAARAIRIAFTWSAGAGNLTVIPEIKGGSPG